METWDGGNFCLKFLSVRISSKTGGLLFRSLYLLNITASVLEYLSVAVLESFRHVSGILLPLRITVLAWIVRNKCGIIQHFHHSCFSQILDAFLNSIPFSHLRLQIVFPFTANNICSQRVANLFRHLLIPLSIAESWAMFSR